MDDQQDASRAARLSAIEAQRNIIVIGGSAGALDAMLDIVAALPGDFPGSVLMVSHIGANPSHLPELLTAAGPLAAAHPETGEPIRPGRIYVAPPDHHMIVENGRIRLSRGPRQHFTRPAVDPLFRSAAEHYGPRAIGVVLSGTGSDGAAGLERIQRAGGLAVVQEPANALYPDMPRSAATAITPDHVVTRAELPALLRRLSSERMTKEAPAAMHPASADMEELERPVALTCPECGGALREIDGAAVKEYRCHIGHRFGAKEVLDGQIEEVDHALGVAVRVLNERVELCRHMVENARTGGRTMGVRHWDRLRAEVEEQLQILHQFLARPPSRAPAGNGENAAQELETAPKRRRAAAK
ncbi:MAG: chemotaxis protein CheB [Alphaproteobacteria bacterium]|nr:chemotaxis protein CheB [Alphaproteobacteria bacterium]MBV9966717.1 chemotaxis protein CheB [Alphaproteobacteria bacterium]